MGDAGLIVSRFLHEAACLILFGGALFPLYVPAATRPGRLDGWLWRTLALGAVLAIAGGLGWFAFTAAAMSGAPGGAIDPQVWLTMLRASDFGPVWLARLAVLAVILGLVLVRPAAVRTTAILAALALASLAATGHARFTEGWQGWVHIGADAVHLIAAGVWLGGLAPLGAALAWTGQGAQTVPMLRRFSGVGYFAVGALLASGLVNGWYLVGSLGNLTSTPYGRLLLVKIVLFGAMTALAAANRFWITPRLDGQAAMLPRLRRHVLAEQALGLLVIAVVALLGTLQPAIEP